jgi:hypothetical protein
MSINVDIDTQEVFSFLDALRDSGATNMFGAAPYIQREFGVDRTRARDLLLEWMESFSSRKGVE